MVEYIRRASVLRDSDENGVFALQLLPTHDDAQVRFPTQDLQPTLIKTPDTRSLETGLKTCVWGVTFDFSHVPVGQIKEVETFAQSPGVSLGRDWRTGHLQFTIASDAAIWAMWILMPVGKNYTSWSVNRTHTQAGSAKPGKVEAVRPVQQFGASDPTIIGFQMISLKAGDSYEVNWTYEQE